MAKFLALVFCETHIIYFSCLTLYLTTNLIPLAGFNAMYYDLSIIRSGLCTWCGKKLHR